MSNTNKPWYVKYHIVPDSDKPRTATMSFVHWLVMLWLVMWIVILFVGGLVLIGNSSYISGLLCIFGAYVIYRFLKKK